MNTSVRTTYGLINTAIEMSYQAKRRVQTFHDEMGYASTTTEYIRVRQLAAENLRLLLEAFPGSSRHRVSRGVASPFLRPQLKALVAYHADVAASLLIAVDILREQAHLCALVERLPHRRIGYSVYVSGYIDGAADRSFPMMPKEGLLFMMFMLVKPLWDAFLDHALLRSRPFKAPPKKQTVASDDDVDEDEDEAEDVSTRNPTDASDEDADGASSSSTSPLHMRVSTLAQLREASRALLCITQLIEAENELSKAYMRLEWDIDLAENRVGMLRRSILHSSQEERPKDFEREVADVIAGFNRLRQAIRPELRSLLFHIEGKVLALALAVEDSGFPDSLSTETSTQLQELETEFAVLGPVSSFKHPLLPDLQRQADALKRKMDTWDAQQRN
jgi:hypothetical protein